MSGSGNYNTPRRDNNSNKPPKVVIINTQYVETDAKGFKDVVQKLTGKDSKVEDHDDGHDGHRAFRTRSTTDHYNSSSSSSATATAPDITTTLTTNISFKDFERLLREMPQIDDTWQPVHY
ncbi:hypothetical protein CsatB_011945 [Cannabis sativa]